VAQPIGRKNWAIAEGYIPGWSNGPEPAMTSHETVCLLNASDDDANVEIMIYFADREPIGPYRVTVPARRTRHVRFNELNDPEPIPKERDYASVIQSDIPIVTQHTARFAPGAECTDYDYRLCRRRVGPAGRRQIETWPCSS
jgi:hypothetical protein